MTQPTTPEQTPCLTGDLRTPGKRRASGALQVHKRMTAAAGSYPSPNYSSRNGTAVTGVVIHTAEGPTDADALGAYFAQVKVQVSSHAGADDSKRVNYVDPQYEAWTLRNGNPWTDNLEMCGFASWTRAQWLTHPGMIQQAAEWVAERCHARNVPPVRLTPADIAAGRRSGYFAHWDYTQATGDGTHWDVGTAFPWDVFAGLVQAAYNGTPTPQPEDDMPRFDLIRNKDNGLMVLAAPGIWRGLSNASYVTLVASMKLVNSTTPDLDLPGNEFAFLQSVYLSGALDPAAVAAQVVAALPSGSSNLSESDVETALRKVLGSLDNVQ